MPLQSVALDHVAVAVADLSAAVADWTALGATPASGGSDGTFVNEQLRLGNGGKVELISAVPDVGESFMTAFLARFGSGRVHHITLKVPGPLSAAVEVLADEGYPVVDHSEKLPFWHEAFLGPSVVGGLIVQVAWSPDGDEGYAARVGRPPPQPVDPGAPALSRVRLSHTDLDRAARLWSSLGGTLRWAEDQDRFDVSFADSPISVQVSAGQSSGPLGLVVPGAPPADRTDLRPAFLAA